jgi:hypothetical protein
MGCPSPRQDLANLRTGNPTRRLGYPRPNKSEHPAPHREPIRRNNGSVPTGSVPTAAGANRYPDYRAPGASSNDARPPPERSRPPHPSRPILSSVPAGRRVPQSTPSEQAPQPPPFPEPACLSPLRASFVAGRKRFSADLLSGPPGVYRRSARNWATANAGCSLASSADASNSIGTMGSGTAVIAAVWGRWCRGSPGYGTQASADCRTDASTTPAAGDRTNDSPGAGADEAAAERTFAGIVRVCGSRRRQQQSSAGHACYSRLPSHSLPTEAVPGLGPPGMHSFG